MHNKYWGKTMDVQVYTYMWQTRTVNFNSKSTMLEGACKQMSETCGNEANYRTHNAIMMEKWRKRKIQWNWKSVWNLYIWKWNSVLLNKSMRKNLKCFHFLKRDCDFFLWYTHLFKWKNPNLLSLILLQNWKSLNIWILCDGITNMSL